MQRLGTNYHIKVEKIKNENCIFFFGFWGLGLSKN